MKKGMRVEEASLARIKRSIRNLTQTMEYRVLELFSRLDYLSEPYYYKDKDEKRKVEVVRELDFVAIKSLKEDEKNKTKDMGLHFIGDVKFYPDYPSRIVVGLSPFSRKDGSFPSLFYDYENRPVYYSTLFSWDILFEREEEVTLPYSECRHLLYYTAKGEDSFKDKEV